MKQSDYPRHTARCGSAAALIAATLLLEGCAIHYRSASTGVEHVWGFGHLQMKAQVGTGVPQAVVSGIETAGLTVGLGRGGYYFNLGFNRRNVTEVASDGANVRLEWAEEDPYRLKVGHTEAPYEPGSSSIKN